MKKNLLLWIVFLFLILPISSTAALTTDLISYHKLDVDAANQIDSHGSHDGTVDGATYTTNGKLNSAYSWDGTNNRINLADSNDWAFGDSFSMQFWINYTAYSAGEFPYFASQGTGDNSNRWYFFYYVDTAKLTFQNWESSVLTINAQVDWTPNVGEYYHIVIAKNATALKFYVNDVSLGVEEDTDGIGNYVGTFTIGSETDGGNSPNAKIDEVAVWSRTITHAEVTELFNSDNALGYPFSSTSDNLTIKSAFYSPYQLLNFNASVLYNGVLHNFTTTTGEIVTIVNETSYVNITITSSLSNTYVNKTYLNIFNNETIFTFNYSVAEIKVRETFSGAVISNFIISTGNLINSSYNNKSIFYLNNNTYNFSLSATGFNSKNLSNILLNNSINYLNFTTEAYNSILIKIYNLTSLLPIYQNVTISIIGTNFSGENITNESTIFLEGFAPGNYTFTFNSDGYEQSIHNILIGNNTYQNLNVYLQDTTNTDVVFTLRDFDTAVTLEGISFSVERFINGSFILINSFLTDIAGNVEVAFLEDTRYRFTASHSNYTTKQFELNPIIFNSYTVRLHKIIEQDDSTDLSNVNIILTPTSYYNDAVNNFSFYITSPEGKLVFYSYNLTYKTTTKTGNGNNAYGETLTNTLNITNASIFDKVILQYFYLTSDGHAKGYEKIYSIQDGIAGYVLFIDVGKNNYNISLFDRMFIFVLSSIMAAGVAYMFGGLMISAAVGVIFIGYFSYINFIPVWVALLAAIPIIFLILGRSTR